MLNNDELAELKADRDKQFNEVTRLLTIFLAAITEIRAGEPEEAFDILCRGVGIDPDDPKIKDEKFVANREKAARPYQERDLLKEMETSRNYWRAQYAKLDKRISEGENHGNL